MPVEQSLEVEATVKLVVSSKKVIHSSALVVYLIYAC